jgi:Ca2+-binding RTX toxin-like protein
MLRAQVALAPALAAFFLAPAAAATDPGLRTTRGASDEPARLGTGALGTEITCYGRVATIMGTEEADVLAGTAGPDVIAGLGGDDTINAGGGRDLVCPGDGADVVNGGAGTDDIEASEGDDRIEGGPGMDFVGYFAAPGPVVVDLLTNVGDGLGLDTVSHIEGVVGSRYDDELRGAGETNQLEGRDGNDVLIGRGELDLLLPGPGEDDVRGGMGFDYAVYWDARRGIRASLWAHSATGAGLDLYESIQGLAGSEYADVLTGDGNPNGLYGEGGADRLYAKGGNDWIYAGRGNDLADGGAGSRDFIDGEAGRDRCLRGERLRRCP